MNQAIRTFKDLAAWQRAMSLCQEVYALTRLFPDTERFGLTAQLRRAVISIPSNIAEGYGRRSRQEYLRFLNIAHGSLCEVETQLLLAESLGFVDNSTGAAAMMLLREVDRILSALNRSLRDDEQLIFDDSDD